MSRAGVIVALLALLALATAACSSDKPSEQRPDPRPHGPTTIDAAPVPPPPAPDAAPAVKLRSVALPVGAFAGGYYYTLTAQVDAPYPLDCPSWTDELPTDAVGVRAAPRAPAPWASVVGRKLAAYAIDGTVCEVTMTGVFLLDRTSTSEPTIVGKVQPNTACVPAVISDRGAPAVYVIEPAGAKDTQRVVAAVAAKGDQAHFLADFPHRGKPAPSVIVLRGPTARFAVVTTHVELTHQDCGSEDTTYRTLLTLPPDQPPTVLYDQEDAPEDPIAALDVDHDGRPELLFGAQSWDAGMSGATQLAAQWPPSPDVEANADVNVGVSYYIGCD